MAILLTKLEKSGYTGAIFNIVLACYIYFAHAWVFEHTKQAIFYAQSNWLLGLIVLLVQVMDFFFLPLKLGHIKSRLKHGKPAWKKYYKTSAVVVFGHILISFLMMVVMFKAFGFHGDTAVAAAGSISTIKELILWSMVGYRLDDATSLNLRQDFIADVGLLSYSAMAYTLAWEPLAANSSLMPDWGNWGLFAVSLLLISMFTAVFLLTLRIPYLVEEWSGRVATNTKVIFFLSFLLLLSGALRPYFEGEVDVASAMEEPQGVTKLYLERKGLTEIPPEIWDMHALRILDLGQNRISTIPRDIASLVNLEVLRIDHNPVDFLPREVSNLPKLRELDIRSTGLWSKTIEDTEGLKHMKVKR